MPEALHYSVTRPVEPLVTKLTKRTTNLGSFSIGNAFAIDANPNGELFRHSEKPENQAGNLRRFSDYSESQTRGSSARRLRLGVRNDGRSCLLPPRLDSAEQKQLSIVFARGKEGVGSCHFPSRISNLVELGKKFCLPRPEKARAFTLAEVLITLGIIGIVAAMTLPTLIQNHQQKVTVAKLKKMNSVLNNAFTLAVERYGEPDTWGFMSSKDDDTEDKENYYKGVDNVIDKLISFLKTTYVCYPSDKSCNNENTKYYRTRYSLQGTETGGHFGTPSIILADGSSIEGVYFERAVCDWKISSTKALQNVCGEILVDVNGIKPPNAQGRDVFWFYLTKYGIIPAGTDVDNFWTFNNYCNMASTDNHNGYGCTAWVIYNENMDYLKCNDLSWKGKRTCK